MSRYRGVLTQPVTQFSVSLAANSQVDVLLSQPTLTGSTTYAGANGVELPVATLSVGSTANFATAGTIFVTATFRGVPTPTAITYMGVSGGNTFTGCAGGQGTLTTNCVVGGYKTAAWQGVDRWLTADGQPPVLKTAANAVDSITFREVNGVTLGFFNNGAGPSGAGGPPGPVGLQFRGGYDPIATYVLNDIVTSVGTTYICIQAGTGRTPASSPTFWAAMAAANTTPSGTFRGAYNPATPYNVNDTVTDVGITYTCIQAGTGHTPASSPTFWTAISQPPPPSGGQTPPLDANPGLSCQYVNWLTGTTGGAAPIGVIYANDAQLASYGSGSLKNRGLWVTTKGLLGWNGQVSDSLWTGDPNVSLATPQYKTQRDIINNNFVSRCRANGITKLFLANDITSTAGSYTVLIDWFAADTQWTSFLQAWTDFCAAAKLMGFDGIAIDCEEKTYGGTRHGWSWNYSGNTHTEAQVRAQVRLRAQQWMQACLKGFPGLEITTYQFSLGAPQGAGSCVQNMINSAPLNSVPTNKVLINFLDGATSVNGWTRWHLGQDIFYFSLATALNNASCDEGTATIMDVNAMTSYLSQNLSNWQGAASKITTSPMTWLGPTNGDGSGYTQTSQPNAAKALSMVQAYNHYGMGGMLLNFTYEYPPLSYSNFTQTPLPPANSTHLVNQNYVPAYAAATSTIVDTTAPSMTVSSSVTRVNANVCTYTGTATDDIGVRVVRWTCQGVSGIAKHTWTPTTTRAGVGGAVLPDYTKTPSTFTWTVSWTATVSATASQIVTFTVEDTKGNVSAPITRVAPP